MASSRRRTWMETEVGLVSSVDDERPGAQELTVTLERGAEKAINYPALLGRMEQGERVMLNTTAVRAGFGTGGYHFVMKAADREGRPEGAGRIVKLRYTPLQFRCRAVEEQDSPYREVIESCEDLSGMPVIVAGLHSQLAPAAAAVKEFRQQARVVYLMVDTAALPMAFSELVPALQEANLLDATVTVGQSFGGDYEAVNLYSGLLFARAALGADVAIVCQGPGNVGTETDWGFSSIAQGEHVNAVGLLGGMPVAVPRISFADPRPRHHGVSRQTLVALGKVALLRAAVTVPMMEEDRLRFVHQQLDEAGITERHDVMVARGEIGLQALARRGVEVKSMGRTPAQDPEFFLAAGAAGAVAAQELE